MIDETGPIQFRRCHVCGTTNESEPRGQVHKCKNCGKTLAPFYYYDDKVVDAISAGRPRPDRPDGEVLPIYGLSSYW